MKVLQISSHYDWGGAACVVATLHRQWLSKDMEAYAAYGRGTYPKDKNTFRFGTKLEVCFSVMLSRITGWNGCFNRRSTARLIRKIEQIQPDIIHMHVLHGYYINVPMLFHYINKNKIPYIWTMHDCHAFTGNCGYFFDCRGWEEGCGNCPYLKNYPKSLIFDHTARMWLRKKELYGNSKGEIVAPSPWLFREIKKSFLGKADCRVIPNGIDTTIFRYTKEKDKLREKYGYAKDEKIILGVAIGYRDERKGADYILQLAEELKEARIILIGWNKKSNSVNKVLTNVVTMKAIQDKKILAEYYAMADVFVIPSLAENYATTVLESLACGTPVVGFDVGGIGQQLEEGKGLTVPIGDGAAFSRAVRRVLYDENCVLRGETLADKVKELNSAEHMAGEYLKLYREVLSEERNLLH
ncbi:MAG: glycosyltransferase [Lachnospiraceae bacterium]|nr:glycosyltransferase [Lachnospiraceae bacterium]